MGKRGELELFRKKLSVDQRGEGMIKNIIAAQMLAGGFDQTILTDSLSVISKIGKRSLVKVVGLCDLWSGNGLSLLVLLGVKMTSNTTSRGCFLIEHCVIFVFDAFSFILYKISAELAYLNNVISS